MATKDLRDIIGLTDEAPVPKPKPSKKKATGFGKKPDGITKELLSLMGERAPPIPISQPKSYKAKPSRSNVRVKWEWTPFKNDARTDGLMMRHWMQKVTPNTTTNEDGIVPTSEMTEQEHATDPQVDGKSEDKENQPRRQYPFAKYNIEVPIPQYTTEQYDTHIKDKDGTWSREETDYLLQTYQNYFGKWPIVWDRYDYSPSESNEDGQTSNLPTRSLEDLKKRFYDVEAIMMTLKTPLAQMNTSEYELHSILSNFDPDYETERKKIKEALLGRTLDEKREEDYLISELKRIGSGIDKFALEMKELRDRLDRSLTDDKNPNPNAYTSSADITALFSKFVNQEKNRKRRPEQGAPGGSASSPTTTNHAGAAGSHHTSGPQKRTSLSSTTGGAAGSTTGGGTQQPAPNIRHIPTRELVRYGISHPTTDGAHPQSRLTSGISMRSDRLQKARTAKSAAQTTKIATVLGELRIPELILLPSLNVCNAFEKMVGKVTLLLDSRKTMEKSEGEIKIEDERLAKQQQKIDVDGKDDKKQPKSSAETAKVDEEAKVKAEEQENEGNEDASADETSRPATSASTRAAGNKRSASVLSTGSAGSTRSRTTKRKKAN